MRDAAAEGALEGLRLALTCRCYPANLECPCSVRCTGDPGYLEAHAELAVLHAEKSAGYGTDGDRLANFTAIAHMTGEPAWRYPRRRAIEKLARMEALEAQGRVDELETEHLDVASLMLCAEALRRRAS